MIGFIVGLILGLILGGGIGVFATALCVAAGDADRRMKAVFGSIRPGKIVEEAFDPTLREWDEQEDEDEE